MIVKKYPLQKLLCNVRILSDELKKKYEYYIIFCYKM